MLNKKGNIMVLILLILGLFLILILGFIMAVGSGILNWTFDEMTPLLTDIGEVDSGLNMTEWADYTITPLNTVVQNLQWVVGVIYFMMLLVCVGGVIAMRITPSKWLLGFFLATVLMLIIASIYLSNIYEDIATDNSELADRLQEASILHFLILNSPVIMTVITFITGIIMFSGMQQEEYY